MTTLVGHAVVSLSGAFDLEDINVFLKTTVSDSNRAACLRVIKKLTTGQGVKHRNRPGETFLVGHTLVPSDDLEGILTAANSWLPHRKGPLCLDKGHGWALNHPLQKLILYKKRRLTCSERE